MPLTRFDDAYLDHIEYRKIHAEIKDTNRVGKGGWMQISGVAQPNVENGKLLFDVTLTANFYKTADEDKEDLIAETQIGARAFFESAIEYTEEDGEQASNLEGEEFIEFLEDHFEPVETVVVAKLKEIAGMIDMPVKVPLQMMNQNSTNSEGEDSSSS